MPAPSTVDEFVDLVRKSAVLDEPRLSEYVQKLKADSSTPKDPSGVAGLFVRDGLLTYFQAEQFLQGKWKRFSIGKYKVLEKLGHGGMGQVFLCEHKLMRRRVAVKVLPINKANDPSSLERFYREARAVAALDHPNIVRAYDIDQDDNLHFLVMEYVDGASLQEMIKRTGPMDPTRACHYVYWSAVGLQHAHVSGLIHRDIKPGNILVDRLGIVKILDLGLARFFNDDQDMLTKKYDESVLGTADYLAPEQAVDSHTVDGRADIYSLGATFYFLLTANPPYAEGTVAQKLLWHQTRSPRPVRDVRPQVPADVARVLDKMMARAPDDRYRTPAELAEALLPFTQTPIPPPPDEEMPRLSVAAQSGGSGQVPVLPGPRSMSSAPRTPPPVHGPRTPTAPPPVPNAAPKGGPGVAVADADTQKNKPVPVVEPLPESAPAAQIWAAISAETANNSRADTDRSKRDGKSSWRSRAKPPAPEPKSNRPKADAPKSARRPPPQRRPAALLYLAVALGALGLVVGAVVVYWLAFRDKDKSNPTPPAGPRTLVVTRSPAGPDQFPTLKAASAGLREGDRIILQDDVEEAVQLTRVKGLVLSGPDGRRVTWRPPPGGQGAHALLTLIQADGARVSGIDFDCDRRAEYAIKLAGSCPGLVLEDLTLADPTTACLGLHECDGDRARPVVVRKARLTDAGATDPTDTRVPTRAAVQFTAAEGTGPRAGAARPASQDVQITDCTVDGWFPGGAFQFDGGATGVEVRHCRVRAAYGVVFRKPRAEVAWKADVVGNTFLCDRAGVRIEDAGPMRRKDPATQLRVAQNYFLGPGPVIHVTGDATGAAFLASEGNFRHPATPAVSPPPMAPPPPKGAPAPKAVPPPVLLPTGVTEADLPTDPGPRFLRYESNSPLAVAHKGKPVGAPPD